MRGTVGIDEAGRGPWAGPVVAGAVFFGTKGKAKMGIINELDDSKKLTKSKRDKISEELRNLEKRGLCLIGIGIVENCTIDRIGIRKANKEAMQMALDELKSKLGKHTISKIRVDGKDNYIFEGNDVEVEYIVRGDSLVDEIKAASIIAKVTRDDLMGKYAEEFPGYHFEHHVGYGTKRHQKAIEELGVCPIHRKCFAPIKKALILKQNAIQSAQ